MSLPTFAVVDLETSGLSSRRHRVLQIGVVTVHADGTVEGAHKPSSEYPFHQAIYAARPEVRGIVHDPSAIIDLFKAISQSSSFFRYLSICVSE